MRPLTRIHAVSGIAATILIATFWLSTASAELFLDAAAIRTVKLLILAAIPVLVVAMATAGLTGARLAGPSAAAVILRKKKRMKIIAANGLLVLVPSALFLAWKAQASGFDVWFYLVQAAELAAGAANFVLLVANARDGRRMTAKRRNRPVRAPA